VASNESGNVGSSGPGGTGGSGNGDFNSGGLEDIGNGSSGSFSAIDSLASNNGNGSSASGSTDSTNPFASNNGNGSSASGSTDSTNPFASNNGNGSSASGPGMDLEGQESRLRHFTTSPGLKDIHFKFDRYDLDDTSRAVLRKNAEYLNNYPNMRVEIQGHCDERGTNNYNLALGQRRAHSTKQYLVAQGVNSRNVSVISYGEEKPFCFGSDRACWKENRRAHFMVSK
jgi:peptidoglycan-associated lipoprotein